jgi:hypothetical protein
MHPMRSFGWALLIVAFLSAAVENAAQAIAHESGFMATSDVMRIMTPHLFARLEGAFGNDSHPIIWNFIILPLLALPSWLLIGLPGGLLAYHFRAPGDKFSTADDDYPQATYEDIVRAAREADEWDTGIPSKYRDLDEYDPSKPPDDELIAIASAKGDPELEHADVIPPARHIPWHGPNRG